MSQNPEISIIVPVYKVEKYLRQCLESILSQTFADWECIVVDDGSPDSCGAICDEFAARDARLKVHHTPNRGVSAARNLALDNACGKFLAFVDPDDWVDPDFLQTLYDLIKAYDAEVAQIGIIREFVGFNRPLTFIGPNRVLSGLKPFEELMHDSTVRSYPCNKLFRRDVVQERFPEGQKFEDFHAMTAWLAKVRRMVLSPKMLYHYRMRGSSTVNSQAAKNRMEQYKVCRYRERMMEKVDPVKFSEKRRAAYLAREAVNCAKTIARREPDEAERTKAVRAISRELNDMHLPGIRTLGLKIWSRACLLRSNPQLFIRQMRMVYAVQFGMKRRNTHLYE